MVRIASLPDLSRFVQREEKVAVYNTVHLLVGEDSVEVSGPVISQVSQVLQDLVRNQRELYLDQFSGEIEGIQDVVEILYGGDVVLTEGNIKTVLKFSTVYQVKEMYQLCIEWLKENISTLDLFSLINFGFLIEQVGQDNRDVLDLCTVFIRDTVKDELSEISKSWSIGVNTNFVKFLVHEEILRYTLPVLTAWLSKDADIVLILNEFENKGVTESLCEYGQLSLDLLEKMFEKVELLATCKRMGRIMLAQASHSKTLVSKLALCLKPTPGNIDDLLLLNYRLFTLEKMLGLEDEFSLEHPQYAEFVMDWIIDNDVSQEDVNRLWSTVRQQELCYNHAYCVRRSIVDLGSVQLPDVSTTGNYKYLSCQMALTSHSQSNLITVSTKCKSCKASLSFKIKFVCKAPCYEVEVDNLHVEVDHVYLLYCNQATRYYNCFSILTNDHASVKEKIKKCLDSKTALYVECMYRCVKG